jgi:hypothetical protein
MKHVTVGPWMGNVAHRVEIRVYLNNRTFGEERVLPSVRYASTLPHIYHMEPVGRMIGAPRRTNRKRMQVYQAITVPLVWRRRHSRLNIQEIVRIYSHAAGCASKAVRTAAHLFNKRAP